MGKTSNEIHWKDQHAGQDQTEGGEGKAIHVQERELAENVVEGPNDNHQDRGGVQ
jgi:hypothetical protein